MSKSDCDLVRWREMSSKLKLKMIRSVLLENLLRFCLCFQPTNIPCLEQSDAIVCKLLSEQYHQDSRNKSSLADYWMLDNLIRFIFSPFVSSQYLGRCTSPTLCSQILLINQVDNGTPGLLSQCLPHNILAGWQTSL